MFAISIIGEMFGKTFPPHSRLQTFPLIFNVRSVFSRDQKIEMLNHSMCQYIRHEMMTDLISQVEAKDPDGSRVVYTGITGDPVMASREHGESADLAANQQQIRSLRHEIAPIHVKPRQATKPPSRCKPAFIVASPRYRGYPRYRCYAQC